MRYFVGLRSVLVVCVVAIAAAACGEESIPCESHEDCPPVDPGVCDMRPLCQQGFCRYSSGRVGAGCALNNGSMGVCSHEGCGVKQGPISCKHGYNDQADWPDGTLCRSSDLREGTCLDGVCGGEQFCEGVVCDEPDNLCGSDQFCNWKGVCEFRQVTQCNDGSTCTFDECDPDRGCVYTRRPDGATCATDVFCCLITSGFGECCRDGTCMGGVCIPN